MPDQTNVTEHDKAMLVNLVLMLGSSAMQQLGKILDPATNKTAVDLEGAQISIDMLAMLQRKTRGNLDEAEQRVLDSTLASLQLNFVEAAAASPPEAGKADDKTAPEKETPPPGEAGKPVQDPKYHKSYG